MSPVSQYLCHVFYYVGQYAGNFASNYADCFPEVDDVEDLAATKQIIHISFKLNQH